MALENGATLILMLAAPHLFRFFSVSWVIGACGFVLILGGAVGLLRFSAASIYPSPGEKLNA